MTQPRLAALAVLALVATARADGPADNLPDKVRPVPRPGIALKDDDRRDLEAGLARLREAIDRIDAKEGGELLPDVQVFHKAVHDALKYDEFFDPKEIAKAKDLLAEGQGRAEQLAEGRHDWTDRTGLVVRGYRSKIDGSIQPYGLVVPESYTSRGPGKFRLDVWFHGRGETLSEVNFLDDRRRNRGQFAPADTVVLHPYGRYCNAFKFAGEVDVFEALDAVRRHYRIDDDRTSVRGFSMGGAACWQFAVHDSDRWFAANPGAGFAETPRFLNVFQRETLKPTWYEQKLWRLYDCDGWAMNLRQCPTVAYSGELDNQKQAADVMAEALDALGMTLTHVIGPGTKHAYHPEAAREVERRMASLADRGRDRFPAHVAFATFTLRYNRMSWVTIDAMDEHWMQAQIAASLVGDHQAIVAPHNVSALTLDFPAGRSPFEPPGDVKLTIARIGDAGGDSSPTDLRVPGPASDRSWRVQLHKEGNEWKLGPLPDSGPRKRHGLQGPIDDAFMDAFVFVRPTGKGRHESINKWVESESTRAVERWRRQFRGEARVLDDSAVTDADIASSNLVLWGDPESNAVLKKIADRLPIAWGSDAIRAGDRRFDAGNHALILIAPNPLNPDRYVVLNSGFTYREYDDLNNARQVPKLPDWAVIDIRTPPNSRWPGKVAAAGFFDESWKLKPSAEGEVPAR